ncbi:MAG: SAM-dependent methyltransferase [Clostridia bacterium]|nr:SAM-dependent methyltransferase [Clostridia bacterium]
MILDVRLRAAADMVPRGARLADIGSDHAYLPITLCLEEKIDCALASDINEGPVAAAVANIKKNNLEGRIEAIRADGLASAHEFAPDCITVLGMGGELIVSILSAAEWIRDGRITLILQPMTHPEILAKYLAKEGFEIIDERIVCDNGRDDRIYRIIKASFNGVAREIDELDAMFGKINLERGDSATRALVERQIRVFDARLKGKKTSGQDCRYEEKLIAQMKKYLER